MFIFRAIKKIIATALKAVYKLLCVFNLQFTVLVVLVGILLWALGVFADGGVPLVIFVVVFISSIILALVLTARKILGLDKKKATKNKVQIISNEQNAQTVQQPVAQPVYPEQPIAPPIYQQPQTPPPSVVNGAPITSGQAVIEGQNYGIAQETPRYFRVKQNPNYVMAEYSNRYELFLITPNGLKKIRTDYKG